jgi:hypothetical protein
MAAKGNEVTVKLMR